MNTPKEHPGIALWRQRVAQTLDDQRQQARQRRHKKNYRTARENLSDLCDPDSFLEYGQLAVAAQRGRRDIDRLREDTAADGVITGIATINRQLFPANNCQTAVAINDYSVLAGTQGHYHHKKLDRIIHTAKQQQLPMIMYTEGGGGRPGDVDALTTMAGLDLNTFSSWAALSGKVPRIAVNNGYCFAGNAALFGCADITIATESSWIGMAGPAMIEGGGLGSFQATDIGPSSEQYQLGVVDLLVSDEAEATGMAKKLLGYFQGDLQQWSCHDQRQLRSSLPQDRRYAYKVRPLIETLVDNESFIELRKPYGGAIITALARIEGKPVGLLASDCQVLGGAIDAAAAEKAARFMQLCDAFSLPIVSLCDTPGFMVGPDNERQAAVRRMSRLFITGASLSTPLIAIFLRKGYGLGAMGLAGGSLSVPVYSGAWPSGEFGGMGLEGAVRLGYKKELEQVTDPGQRDALFQQLLEEAYNRGKATEAASYLELDGVIDPAQTREIILTALASCPEKAPGRRMIDSW